MAKKSHVRSVFAIHYLVDDFGRMLDANSASDVISAEVEHQMETIEKYIPGLRYLQPTPINLQHLYYLGSANECEQEMLRLDSFLHYDDHDLFSIYTTADNSDDVRLFNNLDLLLLPEKESTFLRSICDHSPLILIINGSVATVQYLDNIQYPKNKLSIASKKKVSYDGPAYDIIIDTLECFTEAMFRCFDSNVSEALVRNFRVYLCPPDVSHRDLIPREQLPYGISFAAKDCCITAQVPSYNSYSTATLNESFRQSYFQIRRSLMDFLNCIDISIEVNYYNVLVGFKLSENLFVENLISGDYRRLDRENTFWRDSAMSNHLMDRELNAKEMSTWMRLEGVQSLSYFSYVEHDGGERVAYTFTAFKDNKPYLSFMVSAFDPYKGYAWLNDFVRGVEVPCICAEVKEDEYDAHIAELEGYSIPLLKPPTSMNNPLSLLFLFLETERTTDVLKSIRTPMETAHIEKLPSLINWKMPGPESLDGFITQPVPIIMEESGPDIESIYDIVKAVQEENGDEFRDNVVPRVFFEYRYTRDKEVEFAMASLCVLKLNSQDFLDLVDNDFFRSGDVTRAGQLKKEYESAFPGLKIKHMMLLPYYRIV